MRYFAGLLIIAILFSTSGCQLIEVPIFTAYTIREALEVGTSALPYYAYSDMSLEELNRHMQKAGTRVTIEETYEFAYGKLFSRVPPDGDTGQLIDDIDVATEYFQRILAGNNVEDADHYYLTRILDPKNEKYTLFAAVYRPYAYIRVYDKRNPSEAVTLTQSDPEFYIPYKKDVDGETLDTVYEWFAISTQCYAKQRNQAILFTLAANEVLKKTPRPGYWEAEKKWLSGDYMDVLVAQDKDVCRAVGVEPGFTIR
ncbi:MAG: hypothetical protein KGY61_07300 [Desulfobacterales bacterium]|nr:hypothetical protein [Desulfobacterales bacterium]